MLHLVVISLGQTSIKVSLLDYTIDIMVSKFVILVFEKAGAGVYGMVSVFPSEGGFCVSDAEALKVLYTTIAASTELTTLF